MKRLLCILMLLLLTVISVQAVDGKPLIYLGEYVEHDWFFILDGRFVTQDAISKLDSSDIESVEVYGRPMHFCPELRYLLNGEPISQDEAGNIKVSDILWMKFIDNLTLSIITDPKKVMYVVDGIITNPDSLPNSEDIVRKYYDVPPVGFP